jgi:hypothetical protein
LEEGTYTWNIAKRAQERGYKVEIVRDRFYVAKLTLLINFRRCKLHRHSDRRQYTAKASSAVDVHIFHREEGDTAADFLIPARLLDQIFPDTAKFCLRIPRTASTSCREKQRLWVQYRDRWDILREPCTAR